MNATSVKEHNALICQPSSEHEDVAGRLRGERRQRACDLASSTSILAAGCRTVILLRMVAPSLVMITSPFAWHTCRPGSMCSRRCRAREHCGSDALGRAHTILSIPRGPRLVRIASATALAASIFVVRTSFFLAFSLHKALDLQSKALQSLHRH